MQHRANYIINPLFILSLFLLLANDFYFKFYYPSVLTGKLSDFSGLIVFYGVISFLFGLKRSSLLLVILTFVFWKSNYSQPLIDLINNFSLLKISRVVDYSDFFALLMLPIYHLYILKSNSSSNIKKFLPILLPIAVFSISATSVIDPIHTERYDKYVFIYDYSDTETIFKVKMPVDSFIKKLKENHYTVTDSYYIQPWDGKVYSFIPLDRCVKYFVLQDENIENKQFDMVQVQLKEVDRVTEIRLYNLTLCDELSPPDKKQAILIFKNRFLAGIARDLEL